MVLALGSLLLNPNEMKHIESIQPEYAAGDLSRLLVSEPDATASAALSRLLHNVTGCAIPPTSDTPQSEVEELVPLCLSILRRHWTTPLTALGDGTTPMSLADLLRRLIGDRVQGNEALGIPPANANIPTAVAALTKRHIDDGLTLTDGTDGSTPTTTSLPDGLSLAQLLCGVSPDGTDFASSVTEIVDTNKGWVGAYTSTYRISSRLSAFTNLKVLELGCAMIEAKCYPNAPIMDNAILDEVRFPHLEEVSEADRGLLYNCSALTKAEFPKLKTLYSGWGSNHNNDGLLVQCNAIKRVELPSLVRFENRQSSGSYNCIMYNDAALEELIMPNLSELYHNSDYQHCYCVSLCPSIKKIVLGTLTEFRNVYIVDGKSTELVHVEFGQGTSTNIYLQRWQPSEETIALPEFLSNFKTYIAERLTDHGSGLTLTLSQAVRDAIQTDPDIVNIITSKGWTISPAPSV